ncbi:hypothetical protein PN36_08275 [Candidatus Thiomargarita nelsonii]|uniref:Uncharacterized protein n=1 Tax=Candidatus Thiomargarita nelsonii TaxID=1003181 RepID=A0A0A6PHU5_9GAMM|nr:hypothetical protein PN36_08275 [Candidatus Thiomargarita nelsonii]
MRVIHNKQEMLKKLIHNIGLAPTLIKKSPSILMDQLIAEYLRHALYTLTHGSTTVQPVFVTKLTNQVRCQLTPLWPDIFQNANADDPIRRVLEQLKQVGDVAELGDGYWLPTPLRLVRLLNNRQILLIGGVDTKSLITRFGDIVQPMGFVRRIKPSADIKHLINAGIDWQHFEDWVGETEKADIGIWTRNLLDEARKRLKPSGSDLTDFEVYMPCLSQTNLQYYRWISVQKLKKVPKEIVLCRFKQTFVTYCLGRLTGEKSVRLHRESELGQEIEIRKLLYGLDALYKCPTKAKFEQLNDKKGKLIFRSWLPATQRRLLLALGHEVSSRLSLSYEVSSDFQKDIFSQIQKLGIKIIEEK